MRWNIRKILRLPLLVSYYLFAVFVTSASFGVAAVNIALSLLIICSITFLIRDKTKKFNFERPLIFLFFWLITASLIRENPIAGLKFVVNEYWLLLAFPFISTALSKTLSMEQIIFPLILGSCFNLLGSFILIFQDAYVYLDSIVFYLGIKTPDNSPYALNGKFVQGWLSIIWSAVLVSLIIEKLREKLLDQLFVCIILFCFIILHTGFYIESLSGIAGIVLVVAIVSFIHVRNNKLQALYSISSAALLILFFVCFGSRIENVLHQFLAFVLGQSLTADISTAQRLLVWTNIQDFRFDELFFGFGGGNWYISMVNWNMKGSLTDHFLKWQDFHSDIFWLLVLGGLVAVSCYFWFMWSLSYRALALAKNNSIGVASLGVALVLILGFIGVFNSSLLAVREMKVIILGLIVFNTLELCINEIDREFANKFR